MTGMGGSHLIRDIRARLLRALDAFADGEVWFAIHIIEDLSIDLEAVEGRLGWT